MVQLAPGKWGEWWVDQLAPCGWPSDYLLADGDKFGEDTGLADDIAAPMKSTVTSLPAGHPESVIPAPTTQEFTVVNAVAGPVTEPARGPGGVRTRLTEVRGPLKEHQGVGLDPPLPSPQRT